MGLSRNVDGVERSSRQYESCGDFVPEMKEVEPSQVLLARRGGYFIRNNEENYGDA